MRRADASPRGETGGVWAGGMVPPRPKSAGAPVGTVAVGSTVCFICPNSCYRSSQRKMSRWTSSTPCSSAISLARVCNRSQPFGVAVWVEP